MNNQKNSKTRLSTVIQAKHLSKKLATTENEELLILDDINLSVTQNESVAITGASGSGKTTLLGLLAGLDLPSNGEVCLLGTELSTLNEDQRANLRLGQVGFVFQSFHLMDNLTALENVILPLELENSSKNIRQKGLAALEQVGLEKRSTHRPGQLSGGEQQRVALARAFVSQPAILFADEPTGNLDRKTGEEIIALLFKMQQLNNTTLVLVTHDDSLAKRCQAHYRLVDGKISQ